MCGCSFCCQTGYPRKACCAACDVALGLAPTPVMAMRGSGLSGMPDTDLDVAAASETRVLIDGLHKVGQETTELLGQLSIALAPVLPFDYDLAPVASDMKRKASTPLAEELAGMLDRAIMNLDYTARLLSSLDLGGTR